MVDVENKRQHQKSWKELASKFNCDALSLVLRQKKNKSVTQTKTSVCNNVQLNTLAR